MVENGRDSFCLAQAFEFMCVWSISCCLTSKNKATFHSRSHLSCFLMYFSRVKHGNLLLRFSGVKDALMLHKCIYFLAHSETIRFRTSFCSASGCVELRDSMDCSTCLLMSSYLNFLAYPRKNIYIYIWETIYIYDIWYIIFIISYIVKSIE